MTAETPRRVVVVDDHTFYRDGLVGLLTDSGVDVVADVSTGEESLVAVARHRPDVVVMDLSMPGLGGIESTRRLVLQDPDCKVVMLTVSQDEDDVLNALLAGAHGFVLKDGPIEDLVTAIENAAEGMPFLSERVAPQLLRHVHRSAQLGSRINRLTPREMEVLNSLAEGRQVHQIAAALGVSERAVRRHAADLLLKLQAETRGEIAVRALRDRIV